MSRLTAAAAAAGFEIIRLYYCNYLWSEANWRPTNERTRSKLWSAGSLHRSVPRAFCYCDSTCQAVVRRDSNFHGGGVDPPRPGTRGAIPGAVPSGPPRGVTNPLPAQGIHVFSFLSSPILFVACIYSLFSLLLLLLFLVRLFCSPSTASFQKQGKEEEGANKLLN